MGKKKKKRARKMVIMSQDGKVLLPIEKIEIEVKDRHPVGCDIMGYSQSCIGPTLLGRYSSASEALAVMREIAHAADKGKISVFIMPSSDRTLDAKEEDGTRQKRRGCPNADSDGVLHMCEYRSRRFGFFKSRPAQEVCDACWNCAMLPKGKELMDDIKSGRGLRPLR